MAEKINRDKIAEWKAIVLKAEAMYGKRKDLTLLKNQILLLEIELTNG